MSDDYGAEGGGELGAAEILFGLAGLAALGAMAWYFLDLVGALVIGGAVLVGAMIQSAAARRVMVALLLPILLLGAVVGLFMGFWPGVGCIFLFCVALMYVLGK